MLFFTTGQVARVCGVSQQTVIRHIDSGKLKGQWDDRRRYRRVARESLVSYMRKYGIDKQNLEDFEGMNQELDNPPDDPEVSDESTTTAAVPA